MVLVVPDEYANIGPVRGALDLFGRATDVVFTSDRRNSEGVVLFLEGESIVAIARYKDSGKVATNRKRVSFTHSQDLGVPVSFRDICSVFPIHRQRLLAAAHGDSITYFPEATARDTWNEVVRRNPGLEGYFQSSYRGPRIRVLNPVETLVYDALCLPLKMIGVGEVEFQEGDSQASVFDRIVAPSMLEDQMIAHDMQAFGDPRTWDSNVKSGIITNPENGQTVRLWYANRTDLEHLLGVDLILYHQKHRSFLMIQYKRLKEESDEQLYRIDSKLDQEINRMRDALNEIDSHDGSRLNSNPFFLRFCWQKQTTVCLSRVEVLKGMNVPLDYFIYQRERDSFRTDRGAEVVSRDSMGRYLDNSQFLELFQRGWIGSTAVGADLLGQYVRDRLGHGNSVVVATVPPPPRDGVWATP